MLVHHLLVLSVSTSLVTGLSKLLDDAQNALADGLEASQSSTLASSGIHAVQKSVKLGATGKTGALRSQSAGSLSAASSLVSSSVVVIVLVGISVVHFLLFILVISVSHGTSVISESVVFKRLVELSNLAHDSANTTLGSLNTSLTHTSGSLGKQISELSAGSSTTGQSLSHVSNWISVGPVRRRGMELVQSSDSGSASQMSQAGSHSVGTHLGHASSGLAQSQSESGRVTGQSDEATMSSSLLLSSEESSSVTRNLAGSATSSTTSSSSGSSSSTSQLAGLHGSQSALSNTGVVVVDVVVVVEQVRNIVALQVMCIQRMINGKVVMRSGHSGNVLLHQSLSKHDLVPNSLRAVGV